MNPDHMTRTRWQVTIDRIGRQYVRNLADAVYGFPEHELDVVVEFEPAA